MPAKSGAARIALTAGVPVIPMAHWGAQEVMGPYRKEFKAFPRKTMHVLVGPPVDLDDLRTKLAAARDRIDASGRPIRLEIDGGIKVGNIRRAADAGADTFVAGSAIFGSGDYAGTIAALRSALE